MNIDALASDRTDAAIHRRQLLKIGAWAAPALVLATAAPAAAAASQDKVTLAFTAATASYTSNTSAVNGISASFTITPQLTAGTPGSVTSMTLVVTMPSTGLSTPTITGAGWTASAPGTGTYTFLYTGNLAAGSSTTLAITWATASGFSPTERSWSASVTGSATATTVTGTSTAGTIAAAGVTGTPTVTASGDKKLVTLTVAATSDAPVVARLTVTKKLNNDAFVSTNSAWPVGSTGSEGSIDTARLIATSIPFTGAKTVIFPAFQKQSGDDTNRNYTIEFLVNGVVTKTLTGTL